MKITIVLCLFLLSVYSYSQEVFTGPFITRDDITYDQNTNEPITGIVEEWTSQGLLDCKSSKPFGQSAA
jgi:hypothetical protein